MSGLVIVEYGIDSSGRRISMSAELAEAWHQVVDVLGFTPVITQGGWPVGDAAAASGTTHDRDALDLRTRNLTGAQVEDVVRVLREHGIAAWLRNTQHGGFDDPHIHAVPGLWAHPSPAALVQWDACLRGRDGLKGNGPDYHPYPLATQPPEDDMTPADRARMTKLERDVSRLLALAEHSAAQDSKRDHTSKARHAQLRAEIKAAKA